MATIFLKWPKIKGSATAAGESEQYDSGWIDASSASFSVERTVKQGVATSTNREAAHPVISKISVAKALDKASVYLFQESVVGKPQEVLIHLCSPNAQGKMRPYAIYKLTNCIISQFKMSGEAEGTPKEELQLAWTKIEFEFKQASEDNKSLTSTKIGYDLAKNIAS